MVAPAPSRHPARNVPNRKSGNRPVSPLRSEQARFLAGRGFSGEVIRRVVQGLPEA